MLLLLGVTIQSVVVVDSAVSDNSRAQTDNLTVVHLLLCPTIWYWYLLEDNKALVVGNPRLADLS